MSESDPLGKVLDDPGLDRVIAQGRRLPFLVLVQLLEELAPGRARVGEEGPLYDEPSAPGYRLLFGDLPLKRVEAGAPGVPIEINVETPPAAAGRRGGGGFGFSGGRRGGGGGTTTSVGGVSALNGDVSISPSRLIVRRRLCDGRIVPIEVDLYRARLYPEEDILIQPRDLLLLQYTCGEATMAFIERHLLAGSLFGLAAAQVSTGNR